MSKTENPSVQPNVGGIVPSNCTGYSFVLDPGVMHIRKDGSGYIVVDENDFVLEDDRCEGPDGPEGSVHWIARMGASEIAALRNFLNGAPQEPDATEIAWRAGFVDGEKEAGENLQHSQEYALGLEKSLKLAVEHLEHMAAFIGSKKLGYSFESLGEDMPGIKSALCSPAPQDISVGSRIATAEDVNKAFDPANDVLGGAFMAGFREGWIYAEIDADGERYKEMAEEYAMAVDTAPGEAWDAHREKFFAMLPLAAIPDVGAPIADIEAEIASVVQSVNEWDDRTSPDDYPDHLLITSAELTDILRNFAATLEGRDNG